MTNESSAMPPQVTPPPRLYLTRLEAAQFLTALGVPVSEKTLQKWASTGGGPRYRILSNRALYREVDLREWVDAAPLLESAPMRGAR